MQILRDHGIEPTLINYLLTPLDENALRDLSLKMGIPPREFIRKKETIFKELSLKDKLGEDDVLFRNMAAHPKLIERPIIVQGEKAVLGRPPERVLGLLP